MIDLETAAGIPGIDEATFQKYALDKQNSPRIEALAGTELTERKAALAIPSKPTN